MQTLAFYKGDVNFDIEFQLKNQDGTPYDLTGHSARFKMSRDFTGTPKVDSNMAITDSPNGLCQYKFINTDLDTVGRYNAEVEVTETVTGKILTFRVATVEVRPSL